MTGKEYRKQGHAQYDSGLIDVVEAEGKWLPRPFGKLRASQLLMPVLRLF
jgi:hypothetical protein